MFWEQRGSRIHCDIAKPEPNWKRSIKHVSLSQFGSQAYQLHMQACHHKWLETVLCDGWSDIVCYLDQSIKGVSGRVDLSACVDFCQVGWLVAQSIQKSHDY